MKDKVDLEKKKSSIQAKLNLMTIFNAVATVLLSQQVFYCSKSNFVSMVLLFISSSLANSYLKDIELEREISKTSKKMMKIRKRLTPVLLTFQVAITSMSGFYIMRKDLISFHVNKNNPFTNRQLEMDIDSNKIDLIMESIDQNILLTEEEKEQIEKLQPYIEENPYLNYEKTYYNYATSDIVYPLFLSRDNKDSTAEYLEDINLIKVYRKDKLDTSIPHEAIHQTGYLDTYFLREGFTSLIASEYCFDGEITNGYRAEIYTTEIILEIVGEDVVLEAYSTRNEDLIRDQLRENLTYSEVDELLQNLNEYCYAKRKYDKKEIDYDTFMTYFLIAGDSLTKTIEKLNLTNDQKKYIYYCYVNSASIGQTISKFHFNTKKDQSYPVIEENIYDIYNLLYEDGMIEEYQSKSK